MKLKLFLYFGFMSFYYSLSFYKGLFSYLSCSYNLYFLCLINPLCKTRAESHGTPEVNKKTYDALGGNQILALL